MLEIKGYAKPVDMDIIRLYESLTGEHFIADAPLHELKKDGVITVIKNCNGSKNFCNSCIGCKIIFKNGIEVDNNDK